MDKTTVMAEFVITGDKFDPQVITDILGIQPTRCWTKEIDKLPEGPPPPKPENLRRIKDPELKIMFTQINEKLRKTGGTPKPKKHHFSSWQIETGYEESTSINVQILKIYELLKDKISLLKALKDDLDVDYNLGIVINIEDNEKPGMFFDTYIINFLHEINAAIWIDMYIYS